MEVAHIYTQSDLDEIIHSGVISYDTYIHGTENICLNNIKVIEGYLGFSDVHKINLSNIEEIKGDLWVSTYPSMPDEIILSKLKIVRGSVNLNYTPLKDLGSLEYIGGSLSLRDTDIENLGRISFIGGSLVLPYRLKSNIDLSSIQINGKVRFYKPSKSTAPNPETKRIGVVPSEIPIPLINIKNKYGYVENYIGRLSDANTEQKAFFEYFKNSFYSNKIIDVKTFIEYPTFLLQSMVENDVCSMSSWIEYYNKLVEAYPELNGYGYRHCKFKSKRYDVAWELYRRVKYISVSEVGFYEEKLSQRLFNSDLLLRVSGAVQLSSWGKQHVKDITPYIDEVLEEFENKWGRRFLQIFVDKTLNVSGEYEYYKQFYISEDSFNVVNKWEYGKYLPVNYNKELPNIANIAITQQCKQITMAAEDRYRESIGMNKIGEYWRSETELYYSIKLAFNNTEVKQHYSPKWLGRQHLDIYIPEFNIGIEYQGVQHYRPVDFFGGVEAFEKGQERDLRKKKLCDEHGCHIVYVNEGYNLNEVIERIALIIKNEYSKTC